MLGSNPTRDSRLRRHHADGEGVTNTAFPFLFDAAFICLTKLIQTDGEKRLIIDYLEKIVDCSI